MKKRLFLIIAVLFCVLFLIATAAACADKGDTGENPGGDNPGGDVTENPESGIYYTVTFDTQGGSAMASVEVKEGAVIGNVTLPTKQCAEFVGFAEDANGKEMWDLNSDTVTGNITLYAIWEDAHTWEAWETVSEPTCAAEGARKRICDKCGDDETERIPALGHDFEEEYTVDVAPGCFTKGSESRHCTRCDATTDSREIEALGHDFKEWAYDDTEHWKICSRCGTISEKTGHVYQESGKCECGATEITPGSEFTFNDLGEDTYSLAGYSGTRENIRIPATYNGGTVVSIESSAFVDCTGITSVIVPDSVTSIGEGAFAGCGSLESITIPFIGAEAGKTSADTYQYPFGYIFGTDSYTGGTQVEQYYYGSSTSYTTSTTYYIPASLRSVTVTGGNILYGAFRNCSMLTSVTIGNSVTSIGERAFEDCTGLTSVTIPDSVTSIGSSAFAGCTGLTSVAIPDSVKSIGSSAFYNCTGLTSVTIPDSVTSIGSYAFEDCTGLTSVTIPDSVESIGSSAFRDCTGLTSVTIPDSVTSIGLDAFSGCTNLIKKENGVSYVDKWAIDCDNSVGAVTLRNGTVGIGDYAFYGCTRLTSVTIPDSVTSIGDCVFYGCTGLTSVTIPDSVTSIGDYAFHDCTGLTSVTIPDSVTSIGGSAFRDCTGLTSVTIGNSVESIGEDAFYNCTGLTSVTIPDSVTSIGSYAFSGCYKLVEVYNKSSLDIKAGSYDNGEVGYYAKNVYTEENGSWLTYTDELYCFLYDGAKGYLVSYYGEATDITLPESFIAYDGTTVNTYEIYKYALYAFYGNTSLTSVVIPDSVTSIGESAFEDCTGLTSVTIGNSVTSIGWGAFSECAGLTSVYYTGDIAGWCGISFDNSYANPLYYAGKLYIDGQIVEDLVIPDSVTEIKAYAFSGCTNLTSVVFEDTEGWQVSRYSDFSSYTSLASANLADASTAATYLKSTYRSYYWRKAEAEA